MITRYVDTASTAGGDGTTTATAGANRAFASLREALDSLPATLVDAVTVNCVGTAADTLNCNQAHFDFQTSAANYLEVIGNNTTGKYDTSKYRLEITDDDVIYNNFGSHIRLTNLQAKLTQTTSTGVENLCYRLATANNLVTPVDHRYHNCIAWLNITGTDNNYGFYDSSPGGSGGTARRFNCLAYGGYGGFSGAWSGGAIINYNCTSHGNEFCYLDEQLCINCLGAANTTSPGFDFAFIGALAHDYNASSDDSADVGTHSRINQTFTFVNAGAKDFHLQASDTGAKGFGLTNPGSGLFSDDIDGQTRSAPWDIGMDQAVVADPDQHNAFVKVLIKAA